MISEHLLWPNKLPEWVTLPREHTEELPCVLNSTLGSTQPNAQASFLKSQLRDLGLLIIRHVTETQIIMEI